MESPRAEGPLEAMTGDMEKKENKPRIGITHFERRRHPRFAIDLPVEYYRLDSTAKRLSSSGNSRSKAN